MASDNDEIRRVTVNLPRALLQDAADVTGAGTTETIVQALQLLARRRAYTKAMALKGKLDLHIDLDASRERDRR
jgi:nitrate reductase beta subunit